MSNARGKTVDTSYLSLDTAEQRGFIHRDYVAHCLRWSHVIKQLTKGKLYERACVVDVGCGREAPLAKTMYSSRLQVREYHAIDYGPIPEDTRAIFHSGKFPIAFHERTDFVVWSKQQQQAEDYAGLADVVVSFEVLEHVEPAHCVAMLAAMRGILKPGGVAYISTPCWDVVSCAANHVNEMRYETLGAVIEAGGWTIKNVYGTFASIREYEPYLAPAHREVFNDLRDYYDVNLLACILAPFYPQYSRNCLWELTPSRSDDTPRQFAPLAEVPTPWSSSSRWADFAVSLL
jgi:2-polyprenyl-3-methyl-5-hydroxy-6-metoxy-1,4-benzoquinol methylase